VILRVILPSSCRILPTGHPAIILPSSCHHPAIILPMFLPMFLPSSCRCSCQHPAVILPMILPIFLFDPFRLRMAVAELASQSAEMLGAFRLSIKCGPFVIGAQNWQRFARPRADSIPAALGICGCLELAEGLPGHVQLSWRWLNAMLSRFLDQADLAEQPRLPPTQRHGNSNQEVCFADAGRVGRFYREEAQD
jgi:hypothetical protein